jgi:hypothetical protein
MQAKEMAKSQCAKVNEKQNQLAVVKNKTEDLEQELSAVTSNAPMYGIEFDRHLFAHCDCI